MLYINAGATMHNGYVNIPTKRALREALEADEGSVTFVSTSPLGPQFQGTAAELTYDAGVTLVIAGPDPFNDRHWYATVTRARDGKLKVS